MEASVRRTQRSSLGLSLSEMGAPRQAWSRDWHSLAPPRKGPLAAGRGSWADCKNQREA